LRRFFLKPKIPAFSTNVATASRRRLRKGIILLVIATFILCNAWHAQAQSGVELENITASYRYGEQITFIARIKSSIQIGQASIVISDEANGLTQVQPLVIAGDGHAEYRLDVKQNILRPFSSVRWMYQFALADGSTFQSGTYFIRYEDNRFDWQTLESGMLKVHWYSGDASFGQEALNAAQAGLGSIGALMPLDLAQPIDVFIYANPDDLRGTLVLGGEDWVAGHADPALGVVMVTIEPGAEQSISMEQRIPHELMHVMMYRSVGAGYNSLPAWLREGTATLAETYPNSDYDRALADTRANNDLIPLKDLCNSFPADSGQAFLAYAESRSFTSYLRDTYGSSGLLKLAAAYADGVDCEHGTERVFGLPLSNLEQKWHSSVLGQNRFLPALQNISPYLVLLCLVLIIPFIGIISTLRKKGSHHEPGIHVKK
jgi:peptidase MA superfamily protein